MRILSFRVVQLAFRSVPEEALAPAQQHARTIRRTRRFPGPTLPRFLTCPIPQPSLKALTSIEWKSYGLVLKSVGDQDGVTLLEWENCHHVHILTLCSLDTVNNILTRVEEFLFCCSHSCHIYSITCFFSSSLT
ncbi:hypothetical protein ACS0TY_036741 [Phlomoides rotata]